MATYYHYGQDGSITTSTNDPVSLYAHLNPGHHSTEPEGDPVGAYLARRAILYPAYADLGLYRPQEAALHDHGQQRSNYVASGGDDQRYWPGDYYDSQGYAESSYPEYASTTGYGGWASGSGRNRPYPDPNHIRHLHTLRSLLPYIQPERKLNSLNGPTLNIIEQDTGIIFARLVPKKLLVLFLGRQTVNKFIKTLEREDNENWWGPPVSQDLHLPRGHTSKAAMKILVSWMIRACQYHTMGSMESIHIPNNTFAACSLAQTMALFGLHRDAQRVDVYISKNHFARPIFAGELKTLWNCRGEDNRYVYGAIKAVGKRLRAYENGHPEALPGADEMLALLDEHPRLNARVRDAELNEKYQPVFGMDWIRKMGVKSPPNETKSSTQSNTTNDFPNSTEVGSDTQTDEVPSSAQSKVTGSKRKVAVLRIVANIGVAPDAVSAADQEDDHQETKW